MQNTTALTRSIVLRCRLFILAFFDDICLDKSQKYPVLNIRFFIDQIIVSSIQIQQHRVGTSCFKLLQKSSLTSFSDISECSLRTPKNYTHSPMFQKNDRPQHGHSDEQQNSGHFHRKQKYPVHLRYQSFHIQKQWLGAITSFPAGYPLHLLPSYSFLIRQKIEFRHKAAGYGIIFKSLISSVSLRGGKNKQLRFSGN